MHVVKKEKECLRNHWYKLNKGCMLAHVVIIVIQIMNVLVRDPKYSDIYRVSGPLLDRIDIHIDVSTCMIDITNLGEREIILN